MAISVATGSVPYYGIYNNRANKMANMSYALDDSGGSLCYAPSWKMSIGGSTFYVVVQDYYIKLYHTDPTTKYGLEAYLSSSSSTNYRFTRVYRAFQPRIILDLFNPLPEVLGGAKNCSVYLYDSGSFLFIHIDYDEGKYIEVVLTSGGYIQGKTSGKGSFYNVRSESTIKTLFEHNENSCDNCQYKDKCSSKSASNTSCSHGVTYVLENTEDKFISLSGINRFLLIPSTVTGDYSFTLSETQYLDGLGLVESSGEITTKTKDSIMRLPLKTSHSFPDVSVLLNGAKRFLPLGKATSYGDLSTLRVSLGSTIYAPKITKVSEYDKKTLDWDDLYNLFDESGNVRVFTAGTSVNDSDGYRFYNPRIYTLPSRLRVSSVVLVGELYTSHTDETTTSEDVHPSSSYPYTCMYINSSTSDYANWTKNNMNVYSFEAGYNGSGGGKGKTVMSKISHNGYIRQFAFVPAYAVRSDTSYKWTEFRPDMVILTDYSSGESYYFTA